MVVRTNVCLTEDQLNYIKLILHSLSCSSLIELHLSPLKDDSYTDLSAPATMKQSETQDEGVVAGPEIQATGGDDLKGEYDLEAGTVNGVNHSKAPLESEFVNLTRWQATRIFWKSTVLCVMAMVAVLMDGYAQSIPGSIVSNQGFINQFGTIVNAKTGKLSLNAHYVSIWGGIVGVGILVGQQMGSILADKYGRTLSRIFLTVVFAGAILGMQFAKDWKGWLGAKLLLGLGQGLVQSTTLTVNDCFRSLHKSLRQTLTGGPFSMWSRSPHCRPVVRLLQCTGSSSA